MESSLLKNLPRRGYEEARENGIVWHGRNWVVFLTSFRNKPNWTNGGFLWDFPKSLLWRQYRERQSCMTCMMAKAKPGSQRRKRPSSQCCRDILCCFLCLYYYLLQKLIIILNNCLLPIFLAYIGSISFIFTWNVTSYKKVVSCVNNCPLLRKIWAAWWAKRVGLPSGVCYRQGVPVYFFSHRASPIRLLNAAAEPVLQGGPRDWSSQREVRAKLRKFPMFTFLLVHVKLQLRWWISRVAYPCKSWRGARGRNRESHRID